MGPPNPWGANPMHSTDIVPSPVTRTARHRQHGAGDVAGAARRGQKRTGGRQFFRLGGAAHVRFLAKLGDVLGRLVGRVERRPHRPRRHCVDTDAFGRQVGGQRLGEGVDGPLVCGIVQQMLAAVQAGHRAGVDNGGAALQVRQRGFCHVKVAIDMGAEGLVKALVAQLLCSGLSGPVRSGAGSASQQCHRQLRALNSTSERCAVGRGPSWALPGKRRGWACLEWMGSQVRKKWSDRGASTTCASREGPTPRKFGT